MMKKWNRKGSLPAEMERNRHKWGFERGVNKDLRTHLLIRDA